MGYLLQLLAAAIAAFMPQPFQGVR